MIASLFAHTGLDHPQITMAAAGQTLSWPLAALAVTVVIGALAATALLLLHTKLSKSDQKEN